MISHSVHRFGNGLNSQLRSVIYGYCNYVKWAALRSSLSEMCKYFRYHNMFVVLMVESLMWMSVGNT